MKYLFLLIVIGAAIGVFVVVINPHFATINTIRSEIQDDTSRLQTAEQLKASREQLLATYNGIQKSDLDNLKSLLPDNVNNIRLIIQLNALAQKDGLSTIKNIQYDADSVVTAKPKDAEDASKPYGTFQITFATTGLYDNFLQFISDMEENLRLVDITSVKFSPVDAASTSDNEQYTITIKTYWLRQQ